MNLKFWGKKESSDTMIEVKQSLEDKMAAKVEYFLESSLQTLPDEDYLFKPFMQTSLKRDLSAGELRLERSKARDLYNISSTISQFVSLLNSGTFGKGLSSPTCEDQTIQTKINQLWDDNKNVFDTINLRDLNTRLILEGELFFAFYKDKKDYKITLLDPDEITTIIVSDEDSNRIALYKREYRQLTYDFKANNYDNKHTIIEYYQDYECPDSDVTVDKAIKSGHFIPDIKIYHVKVNSVGLRGIPEVSRSYDWARAHARSLSDQQTYIKAQSKIAWLRTIVTKSTAAIQGIANSMSNSNTGSTLITNGSQKVDPMQIGTGMVSNMDSGIRNAHLEVIKNTGFGEHYYGDSSSGNLATASAMELPAIWKIQERQLIWENIIINLLCYLLKLSGVKTITKIDLEFPDAKTLSVEEQSNLINAIISGYNAGLLSKKECSKRIYNLIGSNNIEQLLDSDDLKTGDINGQQ